jgi:hypothetical protein
MRKKLLITTLLTGFFMVCLAVIADVNGKWSSTFNAPDGSQYPLTYTFKVDGSKLTGTLEASGMEVPIDSGMVNNDAVSFSVTVQGTTYSHKGKYFAAGDSIGVEVTFEGNKAHMTMKRAQ